MPQIAQQLAMRPTRTGYLALCEPAGKTELFAAPSAHAVRAGAMVPVTWRALDADGLPIADPQHFAGLSSSASRGQDDRAGGTGPRYLGDGYWRFNWQTSGAYAGERRTMTLRLRDGSTRTALLAFR
jgi:hypothetical protein